MERYSRQLLALGLEVQQRISSLKVLVVGCGALGSTLSDMLVRLGVKEITVVDADVVELSNLHRTRMFTEEDVMRPKALACKDYLSKVNREVKVNAVVDVVDAENVEELVRGKDVVFDALDNVNYRLILNDACVKNNVPLIYAGVGGEYASAKLVVPGKTACLSCFLEPVDSPNACETIGTTIATVDAIASVQIQLLINYLRGKEDDEMIILDMSNLSMERVKMSRNPKCEACSLHEYRYLNYKFTSCGLFRYPRVQGTLTYSSREVEVYKVSDGVLLCYGEKCYKKTTK